MLAAWWTKQNNLKRSSLFWATTNSTVLLTQQDLRGPRSLKSQLEQPDESSMWRRVLGAQDLADHGEACLQETLPVQSSSLAYRCHIPTDGQEISKKSESASKKSVETPLRDLLDTDQTTY